MGLKLNKKIFFETENEKINVRKTIFFKKITFQTDCFEIFENNFFVLIFNQSFRKFKTISEKNKNKQIYTPTSVVHTLNIQTFTPTLVLHSLNIQIYAFTLVLYILNI